MADEQTMNPADDPQPQADTASNPSELETLKRERDEHYDRFMRKAAEFDNYRKRVERERREQADRAVVSLLEDLLSVVDDFDLAVTVDAGEAGAAYKKGVELIHAKLQELLRRQGVKPIDALGQDFDPNQHEAVMQEPANGRRDNEVTAVLRKGYTLNDRLLRAASVKVAKA